MGLVGALIVRPAGFNAAAPHVYNLPEHRDTDLDTNYKPGKEFLNLFSELDPDLHQQGRSSPTDQFSFSPDFEQLPGSLLDDQRRVFPDTIGAEQLAVVAVAALQRAGAHPAP